MHLHTKITTLLAMLSACFVVTALAQSAAPSFFGGASSTTSPAGTSTTPQASTSQVWSKDDFTKQVQTLKAQNQALFQQKLNAELKPMPAGTGQTAATPAAVPAAPVSNTPAPDNSTPTQSNTPPPAATSSGYTGFSTPPAKTSGAPSKPSTGWGVNY